MPPLSQPSRAAFREQVIAELTTPGHFFEVGADGRDGRETRVFKNSPDSIRGRIE